MAHKIKIIIIIACLFFLPQKVAAESYVLPYPSSMPGNFLYEINLIKESILSLWYFGNFGQFTYNLKESDKYLIEAKTLFEYDQFLLAYKALQKSDQYFEKTYGFLSAAQKEGKNINKDRELLKEAALKHTQVLSKIEKEVPQLFVWKPEKEKPTTLDIKTKLDESILIRAKYL